MHANQKKIMDTLTANPEPLIRWATYNLIALGAKSEWDMDDNFHTTETLAMLPRDYGLPGADDQSDEALRFYGEAAIELGLDADIEYMDDFPGEEC